MNGAGDTVLAVGTATAQRMQAGLPEALKTQDGCEPQDSSPESTSTSDTPTLGSGPLSLHCRPWLTRHDSKLTPRRRAGGKKAEGVFRWMQSIGMTPNTATGPGPV